MSTTPINDSHNKIEYTSNINWQSGFITLMSTRPIDYQFTKMAYASNSLQHVMSRIRLQPFDYDKMYQDYLTTFNNINSLW